MNSVSIWIIKLDPSGGLLKKQKRRLEDIEGIKEKFSKEELKHYREIYKSGGIADLCKQESVIAIGWNLDPKDSWLSSPNTSIDVNKYRKLCENADWYKNRELRKKAGRAKKIPSSVENFQEIKEGAICWVRDSSDTYYVCKVTEAWKYDNTKESWALDIAQRYPCKWVKVGDATKAPASVVKKLITIGNTVSKIDDESLLKMSRWLFENDGEKAIDKAVKEFDDNNYTPEHIIYNITEYEYEDIVGLYMQLKGFFIIPSTRYQSTKEYEFVAINKHGEKSIVQAKQQKGMLKGKDYERLSETYTVYLACNGGVDMKGTDKDRIKEIKNTELETFIKENKSLLLDRIKFLVVYQKYQQQDNQ